MFQHDHGTIDNFAGEDDGSSSGGLHLRIVAVGSYPALHRWAGLLNGLSTRTLPEAGDRHLLRDADTCCTVMAWAGSAAETIMGGVNNINATHAAIVGKVFDACAVRERGIMFSP